MNFLSRMVRFLFWALVVSWSVALLRRAIRWMLGNATAAPSHEADQFSAPQTAGTSRRLVRDPVCGMHVAEEVSISLREGSELAHFCSTNCRDAYTGNAQKIAASG
jgi:YHS domain-containing protein